jgi:penicillin-binding protein 2
MLDKKIAEKQLITRRTLIIGAGKIGLLFLLAGRMFYMQFIKKDEYKTLSDNNRIKMILISPTRGEIFDVNNKIIAKNITCFRLLLDKNGNPKFSAEIDLVTELLELDEGQKEEIQKRANRGGRRIPAILLDCLEWETVATIEERRADLRSLFIDTGFSRSYIHGNSSAHLIGYLGRPRSQEGETLKLVDEAFRVGKNGVERYYEEKIRGEFGFKRIEVNARGQYIRELGKNSSIAGEDLHLNIDIELQQQIFQYLNPHGSSAIVMDCTNGAVLVCTSAPGFDPNQFNKLSTKYWNSLIRDPYKPLIDKTISGQYPPGSIFKIITIIAALESGINPDNTINCTGKSALGGNQFRCARRRGHGELNMINAIKHSCNSYIYGVARKIGADKIIEVAKRFGFGEETGIDLPGELSGFVPTPEWKKERFGTGWRLGDTFNLSIGQGFLLCTPIQLARLIAAIASDGKLFTPKIAKGDSTFTQLDLKQEHLGILKTALYHTMNSPGGTGYLSRVNYKSMLLAGKTGTAQVQAKKSASDNLSRDDIAWTSRNHAIFSGYAPASTPKYAISVYYDHGGGGGRAAAPIAKKIAQDVLKKYFPN